MDDGFLNCHVHSMNDKIMLLTVLLVYIYFIINREFML